MDIQDLITREKKRGDCYRLLAACFYPPDKTLLMEEDCIGRLSSLLGDVCPEAERFALSMAESLLQTPEEELAVEFAKLFVGPFELRAPPYGSVYLDEGRRLMGDSTLQVIEFYRDAGLVLDEEFKELPDHIAAELEFLYYLIHQEVEALEHAELERASHFMRQQALFTDRFLGPWIPTFCGQIKEHTDSAYYSALADCVLTFASRSGPPPGHPRGLQEAGTGGAIDGC